MPAMGACSPHDWVLSHVDGPHDLYIEEAAFVSDQSLECTFVVELLLSGFMDKGDWYADDHPQVDLWDADWNEHLVSVEAHKRVTFRASITVDDLREQAGVIELLEGKAESWPNS